MRKFIIEAVLILLVTAVALYIFKYGADFTSLPFLPQPKVESQLEINGSKIKIEIADTQAKRNKGLGGKSGLAQDEGMLFIFPQAGKYPFWMKGLSFPLDFIWIKGDKVVEVLANVLPPAPNTPDASLSIYQPKEGIDKVLEVQAGTVQRLNIKAGDIIKMM